MDKTNTSLPETQAADPGDILAGQGDVRALMRARDWAATPLGAPETWPSSLRAIVRVMLTSRFAMWMFWGPEYTFLCNDAYLPTVGMKRDWVIGSRSDHVWAEIWPDISPRIDQVLRTGDATWDEALRLYLERSGFTEETFHTFSYSPLADDAGITCGMLCVVAEVTDRIFSERQLGALRDLGARLTAALTRAEVTAALEACLAANPHDVPFCAAYLAPPGAPGGQGFGRAALHGAASGDAATPPFLSPGGAEARWQISRIADGAPALVDLEPLSQPALPLGHWQSPPREAFVLPLGATEPGGPVPGFLVAGLNPHRRVDASYRGFLTLLAAQVAGALARADEYERERERARALAELDRAKTAFFSNVSHEFRTPLTLMLGPLEDAISDVPPAMAALRERLVIAHRNAMRLLRLVNSLLDFSRIEAGRAAISFRATDLAALTAELASSFRSATDRAGLRLLVDAPPLAEPVHVDRDMWEKIVLNLLSNAFKFTFEGEIAISLRQQDGMAVLTVRDTGVGIPAHELPRLFDRFHRVEGARGRSFEGSGIGLALVHELVRQHGGSIAVQSDYGEGSRFTVSVPLGTAHLPAERIESATPTLTTAARAQSFVAEALRWLPDGGAEEALLDTPGQADLPPATPLKRAARVVLADDNADLRAYISRLLTERGYSVQAVADGQAALQALRAQRADLLVTDVMMPGLDGMGLLRAVRDDAGLRDLPVIMLSARAGEEAKVEGLDAGADDYLTKPFAARELLARVSANITLAQIRRDADASVRASEAAARAQAERVQLALDAGAIIGTWVWDVPEDRFTADERFARTFGLDPETCRAGLPLAEVTASIHPEDRDRVSAAIEAALAAGGAYRCEYRVRRHDGAYTWIEANGRVDTGDDGAARRFPGVLVDINHRRVIEAELRRMNDELEGRVSRAIAERELAQEALRQSQKMEAVGQLTGGIAHDFNNLLTIITGNVDMARRALSQNEAARAGRAMENALKGAERAASLTQRLLAFSRRQPLAPKPINVDRLVTGMADLLHRALGETIKLETVSNPGLWQVEADPNQLESAILNLVVNARDAMPHGGTLSIETANARLDQQYSAAHAEVAPGSYVVLAVTDTGFGMTKDVVARVFDPFYTTKEVGKGTGLGLSMVYGFVKQSGGHVKIYSEPNVGTTVKIYLPRLISGEVEEEAASQPVDHAGRERTILVVEDDDDVRAYTVEILRELGYRVLEAHDGTSALRLIERQDQKLDLLFTDVVMPGMSGRELADRAREIQPALKVLYTSGYTRNAIVHGGRLDAGVEMLPKPFTYQGLAEKIADVLDTGRTNRVLVVEADSTLRMFMAEALAEIGYQADDAATACEAMNRVRAAQGRYDLIVIDAELPDKPGAALTQELRAMHADMPILLTVTEAAETLRARFDGDRCLDVMEKPFNAAKLQAALNKLGVRCKA